MNQILFFISHLITITNLIKKQSLILLFSVFFIINNLSADTNFQIKFIENKGQWTSDVLFKADIPGGHLFISKNCLTYYLVDKKAVHDHQHGQKVNAGNAQVVKVFFDGSNSREIEVEARQTFGEKFNYFIGDQSTWRSGVSAYHQIILKNNWLCYVLYYFLIVYN